MLKRRGFTPLENFMEHKGISLTGFTFLELIIVVTVIAILMAMALPKYSKSIEKARASEAVTMLKAVYDAQMRYALKYDAYTSNTNSLDINVTNGKFFSFGVLYNNPIPNATSDDNQILSKATRNNYVNGVWGVYTVYVNETGATWSPNPQVVLP